MKHIAVDIKILDPRLHDHMPGYATSGSAGIDLRACIDHNIVIQPKQCELIPSGIHAPQRPGLCGDNSAALRTGT